MACGTDCFFVARSAATVHIASTLEQMPHFGDVHSLYLVNTLTRKTGIAIGPTEIERLLARLQDAVVSG